MRLLDIADLLECEALLGRERLAEVEVRACYAADLMSDVLRFSSAGALLITGLTSVQAVHTADVADLAAILFVADKRPPASVIELARARGIPLLVTPRSMFETCGVLHQARLLGAAKD